jgi:hypothetical protein
VDSEQWPRACLRAELIERGYDARGFIRLGDALETLSQATSPRPAVLILELRGQTISNEAIRTIREARIPTILLGGNAELADPIIQTQQWEVVLKRPLSLGKIAEVAEQIVQGVLPISSPSASLPCDR